MNRSEFSVVVPASTANLGPGFDSIGLALGFHMTIHASPAKETHIVYEDEDYKQFGGDGDNLILQAARMTAERAGKELPSVRLSVRTDIPLGRGLGSSAAAVAGGIEVADHLLALHLPAEEKVQIGNVLEGHPDNISASIMGGMTVSAATEAGVATVQFPVGGVHAVLLIPSEEMLTSESRGLLPEEVGHAEAVRSSAAANVFCAAVAASDWQLAGRMMMADAFHEPYRSVRFPHYEEIRAFCLESAAFGCAISGAGPSLIVMTEEGSERMLADQLQRRFPAYQCLPVAPVNKGVEVFETVR